MGELAGQVALVTGGSAGIGLATARRLRAAGAFVFVADLAPPPGDLDAAYLPSDVTSPRDWSAVAEDVRSGPGRLSLVHLNAGVAARTADVAAVGLAEYRRVLDVNLGGAVLGAAALVPVMAAGRGGSIAVTASLAGLVPMAADPLYTASKHAVVGWVRAVADQLAPRGIRVNAVCPGMTDTAIVPSPARDAMAEAGFPLMTADEVAAVVVSVLAGAGTGRVVVVQPGREPTDYAFRGVPGPAGGRPIPAEVVAPPAR